MKRPLDAWVRDSNLAGIDATLLRVVVGQYDDGIGRSYNIAGYRGLPLREMVIAAFACERKAGFTEIEKDYKVSDGDSMALDENKSPEQLGLLYNSAVFVDRRGA